MDGEIRTDDAEINLALLSLLLDFGLFRYASLLRLPSLPAAGRGIYDSSRSRSPIQYMNEIRRRRRTASHG